MRRIPVALILAIVVLATAVVIFQVQRVDHVFVSHGNTTLVFTGTETVHIYVDSRNRVRIEASPASSFNVLYTPNTIFTGLMVVGATSLSDAATKLPPVISVTGQLLFDIIYHNGEFYICVAGRDPNNFYGTPIIMKTKAYVVSGVGVLIEPDIFNPVTDYTLYQHFRASECKTNNGYYFHSIAYVPSDNVFRITVTVGLTQQPHHITLGVHQTITTYPTTVENPYKRWVYDNRYVFYHGAIYGIRIMGSGQIAFRGLE